MPKSRIKISSKFQLFCNKKKENTNSTRFSQKNLSIKMAEYHFGYTTDMSSDDENQFYFGDESEIQPKTQNLTTNCELM
jgi:hypothetical protein